MWPEGLPADTPASTPCSKDEETLESVFYNNLYGYNMAGRDGRWISLPLKRKKKMGGGKRKKKIAPVVEALKEDKENKEEGEDKMEQDGEDDEDVEMDEGQAKPWEVAKAKAEAAALADDDDPDDPEKVSLARCVPCQG